MFQEAIVTLQEAEAAAKLMVDEAKFRAGTAIEAAEQAGANKVREREQVAADEVAAMMREVQQKARGSASDLASNMENKKAAIGARAETAMHKTAAFIVERIVSDR